MSKRLLNDLANTGQPMTKSSPSTPVGSGSVQAADGSTISWSTGADGTVTALGSNNARMVIAKRILRAGDDVLTEGGAMVQLATGSGPAAGGGTAPVQTATGEAEADPSGTLVTYSDSGQAPYLTMSSMVNPHTNVASVEITSADVSVLIEMDVSGTGTTVPARVTGKYGTTPVSWKGTYDLTASPRWALAGLPSWPSKAFQAEFAKASYFDPACAALAAPPSGVEERTTGWGIVGRALAWGLCGAAAAFAAPGVAAVAIVAAGVGGATASVTSDFITIAEQEDEPAEPPPPPDVPDDEQPDDGCFAEGTMVSLAAGGCLMIEQVAVDELIASRSELSRQSAARRVTRKWIHHGKNTIDLTLGSGERVRTTPVHRFFTVDRGITSAAELRIGDRVETIDGIASHVVDIRPGPTGVTVYNLTVEEFHTYFVGAAGVWVHNDKQTSQDDPPPNGGTDSGGGSGDPGGGGTDGGGSDDGHGGSGGGNAGGPA